MKGKNVNPMTELFSRELQSRFPPRLKINAKRCEIIFT